MFSHTLTGNVLAEFNNAAAISAVISLSGEGAEIGGTGVAFSRSLTVTANSATYGFK